MAMKRAFGAGASTDALDHHFALPGRDASEKQVDAARLALTNNPGEVARHAKLYLWYCDELKRRVARLKGI